jgi:hypothetical protein
VARRLDHLGRRQGGRCRRRRVDDRGARPEDLGESLLLADADLPGVDVGLDVGGPGRQTLVDRVLQLAVEVEVDEDPGQDEDDGAAGREQQGEPAPQRDRGEAAGQVSSPSEAPSRESARNR